MRQCTCDKNTYILRLVARTGVIPLKGRRGLEEMPLEGTWLKESNCLVCKEWQISAWRPAKGLEWSLTIVLLAPPGPV